MTDATKHDAWFHREVRAGLDVANAGDVVPADEVEADAAAWRAGLRRRMAARRRDAGVDTPES